MRQARILNQELAHLLTFAFHKPKEMPDLTKDRADTGADMRAALLNWKSLKDRECRQ